MKIICKSCKKSFNANPIEVASASVNFSLGRKHIFICDNCKAENPLTKEEFEAIKEGKATEQASWKPVAPKPVAKPVAKPAAKPAAAAPKPKPVVPKPAVPPVKPVAAAPKPVAAAHAGQATLKPAAAPQPKDGTVVVDSLRVRKDHNTSAEIVAGLVYGNKVKILGTWTDGKNTWAQIGPDQWAAVVHNGKKMIEIA